MATDVAALLYLLVSWVGTTLLVYRVVVRVLSNVGLMSRPPFLPCFSPVSLLCLCCVSSTSRGRPSGGALGEFLQPYIPDSERTRIHAELLAQKRLLRLTYAFFHTQKHRLRLTYAFSDPNACTLRVTLHDGDVVDDINLTSPH